MKEYLARGLLEKEKIEKEYLARVKLEKEFIKNEYLARSELERLKIMEEFRYGIHFNSNTGGYIKRTSTGGIKFSY